MRDKMVFVPRSTNYETCSDDEMREVHEAMVTFLHTDAAQCFLWPHLTKEQRAEMLESVLDSFGEEAA